MAKEYQPAQRCPAHASPPRKWTPFEGDHRPR